MFDLSHIDLESMITEDLGPPARRTGQQPFWKCPYHKNNGREEHTPSFTVTPDKQHFKCFACTARGDAVDWVMLRHELNRSEALKQLGVKPGQWRTPNQPQTHRRPTLAPQRPMPDPLWQGSAYDVVTDCVQLLWMVESTGYLDWLIDRGLTCDTISAHRIGCNDQERMIETLQVPPGIVIPWRSVNEEIIWRINVRQFEEEIKYKNVAGSVLGYLYLPDMLKVGRPTLITEGEFDAMLAMQEAPGLVNVTTLGSANTHPNADAVQRLSVSPLILVAFDPDAAGQDGAAYWRRLSRRVRVVQVPGGGDLTDFHQQGGSIRDWVQFELARLGWLPVTFGRPVISTPQPMHVDQSPLQEEHEKMASEQVVGHQSPVTVPEKAASKNGNGRASGSTGDASLGASAPVKGASAPLQPTDSTAPEPEHARVAVAVGGASAPGHGATAPLQGTAAVGGSGSLAGASAKNLQADGCGAGGGGSSSLAGASARSPQADGCAVSGTLQGAAAVGGGGSVRGASAREARGAQPSPSIQTTLWPSPCLTREQAFGSASARLYPLIGKAVWTPHGPSRLVDVKDGAYVALPEHPETTVPVPIRDVLPVAPESLGMTFEEAQQACWERPQSEVQPESYHSPEERQSIRDRIRAAVQRGNEREANEEELGLDEDCQVVWRGKKPVPPSAAKSP